MSSVRHLPRLAGKPLREERQRRGDHRREGRNHHEAQPPCAQPTLVTLPEASLEAGDHVQPEADANNVASKRRNENGRRLSPAEDGAKARTQRPESVDEAKEGRGLILVGVVINVRDPEGVKEGTSDAGDEEADKHGNHPGRVAHLVALTEVRLLFIIVSPTKRVSAPVTGPATLIVSLVTEEEG